MNKLKFELSKAVIIHLVFLSALWTIVVRKPSVTVTLPSTNCQSEWARVSVYTIGTKHVEYSCPCLMQNFTAALTGQKYHPVSFSGVSSVQSTLYLLVLVLLPHGATRLAPVALLHTWKRLKF